MFKPVIVAAAALAIAGSSIVYAQQRSGGPGAQGEGGPRFEHRHRLSAQDMAAFTDARIAALKAGLQLTPDQAKNWPAFEQALRDRAQLRIEHMQAREAGKEQSQPPTTPFDRLGRWADNMAKVGAALKRIADTGVPLYQSLDDAQKNRFRMLAHMLRPHRHHMHAFNQGSGRGWRQGQGYGRDSDQSGNWRGYGHRQFGPDGHGPGARLQNQTDSADQDSQL
jgi:zinc resistance-associated protein